MTKALSAILLGGGRFLDEIAGHDAEGGPRRTFVELARHTGADIHSFKTAAALRGSLFARLFRRAPLWGSAVSLALLAGGYESIYATGEDVALRLLIVLALLRKKARVIFVLHNATRKKVQLLQRLGHSRVAACIVLCSTQEHLIKQSGVLGPSKVVKLLEAVDTVFFDKARASRPTTGTFIACGAEARDYPVLLKAASLSHAEVVIYGHGYMANDAVSDATIPETVTLAPRVSYDALRNAYAGSRCAVLPLLPSTYAAGLNGLLEAMAMSLPVVVTNTEGLSDYVAHGPGIMTPQGDPAAMAAGLRSVIENDLDLKPLGDRNREWVVRNCRVEGFVEKVAALLQ